MSNTATQQTGWQIYKRLLAYVKPFWWVFMFAVLGNIGFSLVDASMVAYLKPVLDEGFLKQNRNVFTMMPFVIVGIVIMRGVMSFTASYCMDYVGRRVVMIMRQELFAQLVKMPASYYDRHSSGVLLSKITYNTAQVASASTDALKTVVKEGAAAIFYVCLMLYYSWQLTLLVLVIAPIIYVVIRFVSKRFRTLSKRIQRSMGGIAHVAEESLEGHKVVKIFGGQNSEIKNFNKISNRNRQQEMKMVATKAITSPLVQLLVAIVIAITIHLATANALQDAISPGTFVSMLLAMMLIMRPIKKLTDINTTIQKGIAAAESIFEVLDEQTETDTGTVKAARSQGAVQFKGVNFAYQQGRGDVLKGINLDIKAGESVAFVGRSGSGKSTLVSLLPRFYDDYQGLITLDGVDIREITLDSLRAQIAMVTQHITLFDDTIANNIAYGSLDKTHTREDIEHAAKIAHVLDFAEKMPEGLDTVIGENGVTLSGGQRQRIAIARGVLKDAPILILDEATSALDTESERLIQQAIDELSQNRTTLVIAHRLSTIEKADKIVVLEDGIILEQGNHHQLLAKHGIYSNLHQMQFKEVDALETA